MESDFAAKHEFPDTDVQYGIVFKVTMKDLKEYYIRCWIPDTEKSCIGLIYRDGRTLVRTPFRLDMDNSAFKEALITFSENGMFHEVYDGTLDMNLSKVNIRLGKAFIEYRSKSAVSNGASPAGK